MKDTPIWHDTTADTRNAEISNCVVNSKTNMPIVPPMMLYSTWRKQHEIKPTNGDDILEHASQTLLFCVLSVAVLHFGDLEPMAICAGGFAVELVIFAGVLAEELFVDEFSISSSDTPFAPIP